MNDHDPVNHPTHYTSDPSGVECIEIARVLPFSLGNAIKYLWRVGRKNDALEDLKKAAWYINDYMGPRQVESYPGDPALENLPWKRIAVWMLYQDAREKRVRAIRYILEGEYLSASGTLEDMIRAFGQPTNSDDHK